MREVFFGAGKIGRTVTKLWKLQGRSPLFIVDNNSAIWGEQIENIEICDPQKLAELEKEDIVYITCSNKEKIYNQIKEYGIAEKNIKIIDSWHQYMPQYIKNKTEKFLDYRYETGNDSGKTNTIIFDLENGIVLGGVEAWVFQTARQIRKAGYETLYLTQNGKSDFWKEESALAIEIGAWRESSVVDKVDEVAKKLLQYGKIKIISNFGGIIFWGACLAKKIAPEKVEHTVVIHNDVTSLYDEYSEMEEVIDGCIVISEKMEIELKKRGFTESKIRKMTWDIDVEDNLKRNYSKDNEPIRIGYAGRITVKTKRIDMVLQTLVKLKEKEIPFICEIAGTGDYSEQLRTEIIKNGMQEQVILKGYIDRGNIRKFWNGQDIMISCSEHEGHSISQMEAMASGVVPVLTDVSGVRDDVSDGVNGFIVPVGEVDMIAEKICGLAGNRKLLKKMGKEAHSQIVKNKKESRSWMQVLGII